MAHGPETHLFELTGGELCLDFANTFDNRTDDERRRDNLGTYRDLIRWAEQTRIVSHADAVSLVQNASRHPQAANRVLSRARQLREAIYAVFSAQAAGRRPPQAPIALIAFSLAPRSTSERLFTAKSLYNSRNCSCRFRSGHSFSMKLYMAVSRTWPS